MKKPYNVQPKFEAGHKKLNKTCFRSPIGKMFVGQTTLITIVLVIVVFLGIFLFLFSTIESLRTENYIRLYTDDLLITLLRTHTGYVENPDKCTTLSDLLVCNHDTPGFRCGSRYCSQENDTVALYLSKALDLSFGGRLDYYLEYGDKDIGNKAVLNKKTKWQTSTRITKGTTNLEVRLVLAER